MVACSAVQRLPHQEAANIVTMRVLCSTMHWINSSRCDTQQCFLISAVIGGAVVGLLCAILCVMFVVYRMRKKDEGSYALDEPKRSPTVNSYSKHPSREFYA
jgi:hypothetical protein